jgi:hypothetical protein
MAEKNPDELGALWIKSGNKGDYMTGTVGGQAVVVFRNDRKTGNQPDWRVLKSKPRSTKTSSDEVEF